MMKSGRCHFGIVRMFCLVFVLATGVGAGYASAQTLTVLPEGVLVDPMAGSDTTVNIYVGSSTNFVVEYALGEDQPWAGGMVHWDEWQTRDLSSVTQFVFGVMGDPNQVAVKFEEEDPANTQTFEFLGVTNSFQYWIIDADDIHVDLSNIRVLIFETSDWRAGTENQEGDFTVYVGGLAFTPPPPPPVDVDPAGDLEEDITVLPDDPVLTGLNDALFMQHSTNRFTLAYDLNAEGVEGWEGVMVHWADWQSRDLSGITQFVFGVLGTPNAAKVEFEDSVGGKTAFHLNGVTGALQHWHIDADLIANLDDIKVINFVVSDDLAGEGNEAGYSRFFVGGLAYEESSAAIASSDPGLAEITVLPDTPQITPVDATFIAQHSSTNFTVVYDLGESVNPWEGAMIHWPEWAPWDLSAIETFVIGLKGMPGTIKVEFEDSNNKKTIFFFDGVTNTVRHWHINAGLIENLHDIQVIAFVVDEGLAGFGGADQFTVYIAGLDYEDNDETDGIPNTWWDLYSVPLVDRVANAYPASSHQHTYMQNFVFNTDPTDIGDVYTNAGTLQGRVGNQLILWSGTPTSADRRYDVWVCGDIMANPQIWTALGLDVRGAANGAAVQLSVDIGENEEDIGMYRTGVKVPMP